MEYQKKSEDLEKCFKFAVEYHLDERKLASNRTTGQYRGLGGIIDSFVIGKLIELGVAKIIENKTNKKCKLDFEIHELTKENISDPDVTKVIEDSKEREPNLFIEIKNISPDDRWIGLTAEQFNTIMKNKLVKDDSKRIILIYAYILTKNKEGNLDPLGVFLKSKIDMDLLKKFCDVGDLYVKIQYIIKGDELKDKGVEFNQGSYLYETDIIEEVTNLTRRRILNPDNSEIFEKMAIENGKLPIIMSNSKPKPKEFGEFSYEGNIDVYVKKNYKDGEISSTRMYIHAKSDSIIRNNVLGNFELNKGKIYSCWFTTVGMNPSLKRNNLWIAQRNLKNIIKIPIDKRMEEISEQI